MVHVDRLVHLREDVDNLHLSLAINASNIARLVVPSEDVAANEESLSTSLGDERRWLGLPICQIKRKGNGELVVWIVLILKSDSLLLC